MFEGGLRGFLDDMVNGARCAVADVQYDVAAGKAKKLGATDDDVMSLDAVYKKYVEPNVIKETKKIVDDSAVDQSTKAVFNETIGVLEIAKSAAAFFKDNDEKHFRDFVKCLIKAGVSPANVVAKYGQSTGSLCSKVFTEAGNAKINTKAVYDQELVNAGLAHLVPVQQTQPQPAFTIIN